MYWNYRIIKYGEEDFRLKEVYYNISDNKPFACTEDSIIYGESVEEIQGTLRLMVEDASKPELLASDLSWEQDEDTTD